MPKSFWKTLPLNELSPEQWESLCDGCGLCCLTKLEDEDSGEVFYTAVACRLLDLGDCRCRDYSRRRSLIPDCITLEPHAPLPEWLPETCAYRLLAEGQSLPPWHPLVSGDPASARKTGHSACAFAVSEQTLPPDADLEDYVIDWPD